MAILFHSNSDLDLICIGGPDYKFITNSKFKRVRVDSSYYCNDYRGLDTYQILLNESINEGFISIRLGAYSPSSNPYGVYPLLVMYLEEEEVFRTFFDVYDIYFGIGYYDHDSSSNIILSDTANESVEFHYDVAHNIIVYFNFTDINNSVIKLYLNNKLIVTWEGNASNFVGSGYLNKILLRGNRAYSVGYSEFIVSDKDTNLLNYGVSSLVPKSNGLDTDFVGGYGDIDDINKDDNDYIFSDSPGQKQSFNFKTLLDVDDETIEKLALSARVKMVEGSGITKFRFYFVLDGTKYYSNYYSVQTYWDTYRFEQDVRPDNGLKWTRDDLLSIEVGVESAE